MNLFKRSADYPLRLEAAKRLCKLFGLRAQLDGTLEQSKEFMPKDVYDIISSATDADLIPAIAPLYAEAFTVEELNTHHEYLSTPAGKKFLDLQPQIFMASQAAIQNWMQARVKAAHGGAK